MADEQGFGAFLATEIGKAQAEPTQEPAPAEPQTEAAPPPAQPVQTQPAGAPGKGYVPRVALQDERSKRHYYQVEHGKATQRLQEMEAELAKLRAQPATRPAPKDPDAQWLAQVTDEDDLDPRIKSALEELAELKKWKADFEPAYKSEREAQIAQQQDEYHSAFVEQVCVELPGLPTKYVEDMVTRLYAAEDPKSNRTPQQVLAPLIETWQLLKGQGGAQQTQQAGAGRPASAPQSKAPPRIAAPATPPKPPEETGSFSDIGKWVAEQAKLRMQQ